MSLLDIFIPKNFFKSLANNQIPAVVIFCLALGIALIDTANKKELFKLFDVLAEAVMKVIKFVVKLTPIGVFVMTANAAGTMTFEDIGRRERFSPRKDGHVRADEVCPRRRALPLRRRRNAMAS